MKKCCENCEWYWQNNDTGDECEGQDEVCYEFIEKRLNQVKEE